MGPRNQTQIEAKPACGTICKQARLALGPPALPRSAPVFPLPTNHHPPGGSSGKPLSSRTLGPGASPSPAFCKDPSHSGDSCSTYQVPGLESNLIKPQNDGISNQKAYLEIVSSDPLTPDGGPRAGGLTRSPTANQEENWYHPRAPDWQSFALPARPVSNLPNTYSLSTRRIPHPGLDYQIEITKML